MAAAKVLLVMTILLSTTMTMTMVSATSSSSSSSSSSAIPPPAFFTSSSPPRRHRPAATTTTTIAAAVPPSSSSSSSSSSEDVAVVGCGVLGSSLCRMLLSHPSFVSRSIIGITRGTSRHDALRDAVLPQSSSSSHRSGGEDKGRFRLATMEEAMREGRRYRDVVFCAPPSGFDDYPRAVDEVATSLWSGPSSGDGGGTFVFTSSGVVYGEGRGEVVDEASPTPGGDNPRVNRMLDAERSAVSRGGCALRLAGLYTLERGAHNHWLVGAAEKGTVVRGRGDGIINLLHYDDAASATLAALVVGPGVNAGKIFLVSDGSPTTRREICESALKNPSYGSFGMPSFEGDDDDGGRGGGKARGKVYDGRRSNEALRWTPTYPSFDEFMTSSSSIRQP